MDSGCFHLLATEDKAAMITGVQSIILENVCCPLLEKMVCNSVPASFQRSKAEWLFPGLGSLPLSCISVSSSVRTMGPPASRGCEEN